MLAVVGLLSKSSPPWTEVESGRSGADGTIVSTSITSTCSMTTGNVTSEADNLTLPEKRNGKNEMQKLKSTEVEALKEEALTTSFS